MFIIIFLLTSFMKAIQTIFINFIMEIFCLESSNAREALAKVEALK